MSGRSSCNSFLVEVDDIQISTGIRKEIESRFRASVINKNYVFPRIPAKENFLELRRSKFHSEKNLSIKKTSVNPKLSSLEIKLPIIRRIIKQDFKSNTTTSTQSIDFKKIHKLNTLVLKTPVTKPSKLSPVQGITKSFTGYF
jgi:hypothetical protein